MTAVEPKADIITVHNPATGAEVGSVPERWRLEPPVVTAESVDVDVPLRRPAAALPAVASAGMPGWHACKTVTEGGSAGGAS